MDYSILVMAIITGGSIATAIFMWLLACIAADNKDKARGSLKKHMLEMQRKIDSLEFQLQCERNKGKRRKRF